jgi:nucleoside-diphosphate-sugar epimerase
MSKRVLLLGASGLLGAEVIRCQRRKDVELLGLYHAHSIEPRLLRHCSARRLNILDKKALESVISDFNPEVIINCAARIFGEQSCAARLDGCRINAGFNFVLLDLCRRYSVKKIVNCSSVSVYPPGRRLHAEEDAAIPADYYGLTKLMGEEILKADSGTCGVKVVNLRFCGLYGIKRKSGAMYNFLKAAIKKDPLRVPKSPALFQFLPAWEAAEAVWLAVFKKTNAFVTYNIGLKKPVTLLEVASQIKCLVPGTKIIKTGDSISQMPLMNIRNAQRGLLWESEPLPVGIKNFYMQLSEAEL